MGFYINNIYSIIYIIFIYILATNWQLCRQHIFIYHYYCKINIFNVLTVFTILIYHVKNSLSNEICFNHLTHIISFYYFLINFIVRYCKIYCKILKLQCGILLYNFLVQLLCNFLCNFLVQICKVFF